MSKNISQVITGGNPEALENYVKLYLTNDEKNLERIYQQLKQYQETEKIKNNKRVQAKKSQSNSKKMSYKQKNSQEYFIKSSQLLMKNLRDRGIKLNPSLQSEERGQKIYQKLKDRISKPLMVNSQVHMNKESKILKQLSRYYINKNYYENQIEDVEINQEQQYDRQMKEFLERRNHLLADLKAKKNTEAITSRKYSHIESKYKQSFQSLQSSCQQKYRQSYPSIVNSKIIIQECDDYHQTCFIPKSCSVNHFTALSNKLQKEDEKDQVAEDILKKLKQSKLQALDKYDNSYMKMMSIAQVNKCKLNKYQKDLLQNQIKMRHIINFSDKALIK